ncbi:MAG: Enolase, partial [Patescibacteria group bacterium]|nr:Enolase [Patescibacteria group bacterium]
MQIASIKAYQVLDSRGEPTIRVRMESASGNHARFDAPSSLSVGTREAKERRDNAGGGYNGNTVTGNIEAIENIIAPKFIGYPLAHQADFDALLNALDGTADKSNLGSNTLTALSGAYFLLSCYEQDKEVWRATADILGTKPEMPRIYANLVSGGAHAPGLDVQEFMIVPKTTDPAVALELIYSVHHTAKQIFRSLYGPSVDLVAEEGSMAPIGIATETVLEAFEQLSRRYNQAYQIALDMAAYNLFQNGQYMLGGQPISMDQLGATYMQWDQRFPLLSIEDPFAENDLEGLKYLLTQPSRKFMAVGDATTATAAGRIAELGQQRLIGGVVIKPDQTGTITEMLDAIRAALQSGVKVILAHRSGETNDTYLADIAYGVGAFGLKAGAPVRGERVAKYNRLIEIAADNRPPAQPQTQNPVAINPSLAPIPPQNTTAQAPPRPMPAQPMPIQPQIPPVNQAASAIHFDRPLYPAPAAGPIPQPSQAPLAP